MLRKSPTRILTAGVLGLLLAAGGTAATLSVPASAATAARVAGRVASAGEGAGSDTASPGARTGDTATGKTGTGATNARKFGLTVSWNPVTAPVQAKLGDTTTGTFWVTNSTTKTIPVSIHPGISIPGDNGQLSVRPGTDRRFSKITYTPSSFDAKPGSTTAIAVRVTMPGSLTPGIYLIPAVVQPHPPASTKNIRIVQQTIAPIAFRIPGSVPIHLKATFATQLLQPDGRVSYSFRGLPAVQVGSTGSATLRVLNQSKGSFYSYNEIISRQYPGGTAILRGHTPNAPNDLRNQSDLYFPGRYRDFPISWQASPLGVGVAHLSAYVSYNPTPSTVRQNAVSTAVLVISPWWFLAVAAYLTVLLLRAIGFSRRARRVERGRRSRHGHAAAQQSRPLAAQITAWVILAAVTAFVALLSSGLLFGALSLLGLVAAAVTPLARRQEQTILLHRMRTAREIATGLVLAAGTAALIAASVGTAWPSIPAAMALLASAGVWLLASAVAERLPMAPADLVGVVGGTSS